MPDSLSTFEAELARLRPAAPPPALEEAIARTLAIAAADETAAGEAEPRVVPFGAPHWLAWAAAACLALSAGAATFLAFRLPPAPESLLLQPAQRSQRLIAATDKGIVLDAAGLPYRQVHARLEETFSFRDASGRRTLTFTTPREEFILVPVNAY